MMNRLAVVLLICAAAPLGFAQATAEAGILSSGSTTAAVGASKKLGGALNSRLERAGKALDSGSTTSRSSATSASKITTVAGSSAASGPAKPRPPAVFILSDGKQIEAKDYTITRDSVQLIQSDGATRKLAISTIDVAATTRVNRDRGLDLKFPLTGNELTVSF